MADADLPSKVLSIRFILHLGHAPNSAHALDGAIEHSYTSRIIAAVFKAAKSFNQNGHYITGGDSAYDSTHKVLLYFNKNKLGDLYRLIIS
jgi:hypothetical protein